MNHTKHSDEQGYTKTQEKREHVRQITMGVFILPAR